MEMMTAGATEKRIDDLRDETRAGFARVDAEMRAGFARVDADIRELRADLKDQRAEMKAGFEALDAKFDAKFDRLNRTIVYLLGGSLSVLTGGLLAAAIHSLF
jgi:hypothetical protein